MYSLDSVISYQREGNGPQDIMLCLENTCRENHPKASCPGRAMIPCRARLVRSSPLAPFALQLRLLIPVASATYA